MLGLYIETTIYFRILRTMLMNIYICTYTEIILKNISVSLKLQTSQYQVKEQQSTSTIEQCSSASRPWTFGKSTSIF